MVHTSAAEFLHQKKTFRWTKELRFEYSHLLPAQKAELCHAAKARRRPMTKILADLRRHDDSFIVIRMSKNEPYNIKVHVSTDMEGLVSQINDPLATVSDAMTQQRRLLQQQAQVPVGTVAADIPKDVHSMRKYIGRKAKEAYEQAGFVNMVPWERILKDEGSQEKKAPGFFIPRLTSPYLMSAAKCREVLSTLDDLKFCRHSALLADARTHLQAHQTPTSTGALAMASTVGNESASSAGQSHIAGLPHAKKSAACRAPTKKAALATAATIQSSSVGHSEAEAPQSLGSPSPAPLMARLNPAVAHFFTDIVDQTMPANPFLRGGVQACSAQAEHSGHPIGTTVSYFQGPSSSFSAYSQAEYQMPQHGQFGSMQGMMSAQPLSSAPTQFVAHPVDANESVPATSAAGDASTITLFRL